MAGVHSRIIVDCATISACVAARAFPPTLAASRCALDGSRDAMITGSPSFAQRTAWPVAIMPVPTMPTTSPSSPCPDDAMTRGPANARR